MSHGEPKVENQNGNFQTWPGIRVTFGDILPGVVVLELVESSSGRGVELLRWEAETYEIAPQFKEGEIIYTAGHLHPSLLEATRLPTRAGRIRGSREALLEDGRSLPRPHRAFARAWRGHYPVCL